jgi:hypothetical protein
MSMLSTTSNTWPTHMCTSLIERNVHDYHYVNMMSPMTITRFQNNTSVTLYRARVVVNLRTLHAAANVLLVAAAVWWRYYMGTYVRASWQWKQCVADVGEADMKGEKMKWELDRCARWFHVVNNCDWRMCLVAKRYYKPAAVGKIWDWFEHWTLNRLPPALTVRIQYLESKLQWFATAACIMCCSLCISTRSLWLCGFCQSRIWGCFWG